MVKVRMGPYHKKKKKTELSIHDCHMRTIEVIRSGRKEKDLAQSENQKKKEQNRPGKFEERKEKPKHGQFNPVLIFESIIDKT
jgi:hypothetical protein